MIETLVVHNGRLVRGALAFVLDREPDIAVVADLERAEEVPHAVAEHRPDVVVVDLDLLGVGAAPRARDLHRRIRGCRLLALTDPRRSGSLKHAMARAASRGIGFLAKDASPRRLVEAVRQVARGEPFLDPELVVAALNRHIPLTAREVEVLRLAANGEPIKDMAAKLSLSPGTVRNYVSRIISKTGARTRIEAVRIALDSGWI